jgi:uncharacterized protein YbjQ (UPF0145 family)
MSETTACDVCSSPKAVYRCGVCSKTICKKCRVYVDTHTFSFFSKVPPKLLLADYCPECHEREVLPEQARYDELMEKAKDVYYLSKAYPGYVRVLRRHTKRVTVESCPDRRETILRMAFWAAELNFNAIIEAEVDSAKVRHGGYQTSIWKGSALPANIDGEQLERSSLRRL